MTSTEQRSVAAFADAGVLCDDQGLLPEALQELDGRLAGRLRATWHATCDTPPDLHGLCMRCGRPISEPVASHKTGCGLALPFACLHRLFVRGQRLGALMWAAARRSA